MRQDMNMVCEQQFNSALGVVFGYLIQKDAECKADIIKSVMDMDKKRCEKLHIIIKTN